MADQERHPAKPKAQKEESGLMRNGGHGSGGSENSDPLGLFSIFLARARFVIFVKGLDNKKHSWGPLTSLTTTDQPSFMEYSSRVS